MKKLFFSLLFVTAGLTCWADEYYIVGDASPCGWSQNDARKMMQMTETTTPGVYEYKGLLKNGGSGAGNGFYICTALSGWSALYPSEQYPISDTGSCSYQTATEYKWNPTNTNWQYYTITLNTNDETLSWAAGDPYVTPDADGFYNIDNAKDLFWFSRIAIGTPSVKAKLTADIDYTAYPTGFIGLNSNRFAGAFDGQEHTVTLGIVNDIQGSGLFGVVNGATIKNLVIDGNIEASKKWIGGIGGVAYGNCTVENIVVKTAIKFTGSGDATLGGLFGDIETGFTVKNCAFYGSVDAPNGQNVRGLASWCSNSPQFTNCIIAPTEVIAASSSDYANGTYTKTNCIKVDATDARFATGELCYTMNGDQTEINWYQAVGTDAQPLPFSSHGRVYANGELKCDGTSAGGALVYSNSSTSTIPPHTDADGWCSVCGSFLDTHLTPDADGFYNIANGADLYWFATLANTVNTAKAKLTADIDYTAYPEGFIGVGAAYGGTFDGQEHTITVAFATSTKIRGLFASINGATIKNLIVDGSITSSVNNIGGFGGQSSGTNTVENVVVKTAITYTPGSGDASIGGFFPYIPNGTLTLKNSAFVGKVLAGSASGNAGIIGWNSGSLQATNCLIAPTEVIANEFKDYTRGNGASLTNCFRADGTDARFATGEYCYMMNGEQAEINWYQTIGTDSHPVPFASHGQVYISGELGCDGLPVSGETVYSNSPSGVVPPHTNDGNGFCLVCGKIIPDYLTAEADGFYAIDDAAKLFWFASYVKSIDQTANAKLTADIDYTLYEQGFIGTSVAVPFRGTFDGQKHTVTINIVNDGTVGLTGLFAYINGATVKNLVVDGNTVSSNKNIGGLGGQANGSSIVENVVVKTSINYLGTGSDASCGGFFAYNDNGSSLTVRNSAFYGCVKAGTASGNAGLVSWNSGTLQATNCLIAPTEVEASEFKDYARPNAAATNCYSVSSTDGKLVSGELCYLLNGSACYAPQWTQTIGTDNLPVPFDTKGIVSKITSAGYATLFIPTTDVTIPAGVEAFAGKVDGESLKLTKIEGAIAKGDAVVLKGSEDYYSFVPTTGATPAAQNELTAATTETAANGTQYILAENEGLVGFYKAEGTIPAGKAFIVSSAGIKAFFFDADDATAIEETLSNSPLKGEDIYNLAGQRMNKMQKGINIVGGKKVMLK